MPVYTLIISLFSERGGTWQEHGKTDHMIGKGAMGNLIPNGQSFLHTVWIQTGLAVWV